jgi:hypothetical protein
LQREQQRAAEVGDVADLHDVDVGFAQQQIARDDLVLRLRQQTVDPGRVDDGSPLIADDRGGRRHLDGGAGIVRNGDVAIGQAREKQRLADIRIANQQQRPRAVLGFFFDRKLRHSLNDGTRQADMKS